MKSTARFSVDPRLSALLGESYTSSERALRELVDNAWDAEALVVKVTLPDILARRRCLSFMGSKEPGKGTAIWKSRLQRLRSHRILRHACRDFKIEGMIRYFFSLYLRFAPVEVLSRKQTIDPPHGMGNMAADLF